jgi:hypothetical protein
MAWRLRLGRDPELLHLAVRPPCLGARESAGMASACNHAGSAYRVQAVNDDTGEVRDSCACTNHAAELAHRHSVTFPPGVWKSQPPLSPG